MAHCDARLSDLAGLEGPSSAALLNVDPDTAGSLGLGCVSDTHIAACTYAATTARLPTLIIYDDLGNRLWDDDGLLGWTAVKSAPLIDTDGTVIAASETDVLRIDPANGEVLWQSSKRDRGDPISPVLVRSPQGDMVFIATWSNWGGLARRGTAEVSVWDAESGARLFSRPLVDASGRLYVTRNTPAVVGTRAYVLAGAHGDLSDGRLYALDVCDSSACGRRGKVSVAWYFEFHGGSGSSPLVIGSRIYFDGRTESYGGTFMAVEDLGTEPQLLWEREFPSTFYASAVQDTRGGVWVATAPATTLLRLNEDTGETDQTIDVSDALGLPPDYAVGSVITASFSESAETVLTFGVFVPSQDDQPTYLTALDVSTTESGSPLWTYPVADSFAENAAVGQLPVLIDRDGARKLVFPGKASGTFFVGEQ